MQMLKAWDTKKLGLIFFPLWIHAPILLLDNWQITAELALDDNEVNPMQS